jgi:K+-transporting ATPase ATPase C chain
MIREADRSTEAREPGWTALFRPALTLLILFTLITGVLYPLAVTGVAQLVFPARADGSLLVRDGEVIGSALIGQPFDDACYFWGRPSATAPFPYNAQISAGANLGPSNPGLAQAVADRAALIRAAHPGETELIPVDLVTASASGLDPHISPAAARYQVSRVARCRGLDKAAVRRLVDQVEEGRQFGILGEPRVNVLRLNLALDEMASTP